MSRTPWWLAPVVAGDAGPVEHEGDGLVVEADVVHDLVDGPGEERRVEGDDRPQPAHGHAGGGGDGVLLGDADVDEPLGEPLAERQQAGGVGHGRGDGDQLRVGLAGLADRLGERGREAAGLGVGHVVEALDVVALGRRVAPPLLGQDVDDDRARPRWRRGAAPSRGRGCRGRRTGRCS